MARKTAFGSSGKETKARKKTRQGSGRGTKHSTRVGSKRFKKKKYRGQGRVKEISTWSGASLVALGLLVVLGGPLVKWAAYAAIIWGIVSMVKKQG